MTGLSKSSVSSHETMTRGATSISRRGLVKGAAGVGIGAAASSAFAVPKVVGQEKTPVTFWTTFSADGFENVSAIVNAFNEQSQDVVVEIIQIPPADVSDSSRLITAVRGGTGPDCYHLDRFIVAERAAQGLLQDLTPLCEQYQVDPQLSDWIGFARAEALYDEKPYALPFDTDLRALYVNRGLAEAGGVDLSLFDPANGPITWDQLKEISRGLNVDNPDGLFAQMGFVPWFGQGSCYTYGFSWHGDFMNYDACEVTPTDPEIVASGEWVYSYAEDIGAEKIQAFIQAATRTGAPPTENPWIQGRLAFLVNGDWGIRTTERYVPDLDFIITYLPVPETGMESSTWAGGWSTVIPTGAQQPEAAFQFMKFFCGPEGQRMYVQSSAHTPTWTALFDEDIFHPKHQFFIDNLLDITRTRPPLPVGAKYWDELVSAWEAITLTQEQPALALQQAKDNTMPVLQQFCPVPAPVEQR